MNVDDPNRSVQFCERIRHKVHEDERLGSKIVRSDEAIFTLNGIVNSHNFVYWAPENPHIFEDTITCFGHPFYLPFNSSTGMSYFTFNKMAYHHTTTEVRSYLDETLPGQWMERKASVQYPPHSTDLTSLASYLWGSLKAVVRRRNAPTLQTLWEETEMSRADIPADT
jgi:hypothetical protein